MICYQSNSSVISPVKTPKKISNGTTRGIEKRKRSATIQNPKKIAWNARFGDNPERVPVTSPKASGRVQLHIPTMSSNPWNHTNQPTVTATTYKDKYHLDSVFTCIIFITSTNAFCISIFTVLHLSLLLSMS
jgi:hypothetical protein